MTNHNRLLVERALPRDGRHARPARTVTINLAESPLGWLRARGMIDARQFDAGERLRADYERAALAPSVTMRWDPTPIGSGGGIALDPTTAQLAARQRFDAALVHLGAGMSDIAWRVICTCESLPLAERALGWPARSGRLVLTLALDRLTAFYRL